MFDFNTAKEDIENTQSLNDILNHTIWDAMLMSAKLKYLMGINNFAAIMSHGKLLKVDSPIKVRICTSTYKSIRDKQANIINTMYYKMYWFGKEHETLNDREGVKEVIFKLFDAVTIKYTYVYLNDLEDRTYEIINTDYEKLKINLFDTQTFLKN